MEMDVGGNGMGGEERGDWGEKLGLREGDGRVWIVRLREKKIGSEGKGWG